MQKKKILFLTEASFLSTGYAVYGREIMKRLHKTGKYEIAELGCYGHVAPMPNEIEAFIRINGVPRMFDIPWTYYGNIPSESEEEAQVYNSNMTNQYGEWRFERVCLDFKPDVVCDFRDFWMHEYVQRSPYRNYFSFAVMPTVDSAPLQEQWLYTYSKADAVLAYSEYGEKVLKESTNGFLKFAGIASPAANPDIFKPVIDKEAHKAKMGFESGVKIIGTVMRNQGRKLYPDLFDLFSRIKQDNVYLYCHTCHPDIGWDIPYFLKYFDIGNKVLFTYKCFNCGHVFPGFFNDGKRTCPNCHTVAAKMPNTHNGISDVELAAIYNLFDLYVQYSTCMPAGEKVYVNNEWKNIEDVKVGDVAFTHKGRWMNVKNTFKNKCDDDILEFEVCGDFDTSKYTKEHPILCFTKKKTFKATLREQLGNILRLNGSIPEPEFEEAQNIKERDLLAFRINDEIVDYKRIKCFNIDNDFCRFVGLFAGDGSWDKLGYAVKVTSNLDEIENHKLCYKVMSDIEVVKERKYKNRKAKDIFISDSYTNKVFSEWFLKHENKQLPKWTELLPLEKQKNVIQGLMMADGHYLEKDNVTVYVTISINLARQLKNMLRRLRVNFNCRKVIKGGNRKPQYRFEIVNNIKLGNFEQNKRKSTHNLYYKNFHLMQVKSINKEKYNGYVYNFEVEEDNSYLNLVTNSHNCEGFGLPVTEASFCGVPTAVVNYSAMESFVENIDSIPLPVERMFWDTGTCALRALPNNYKSAELLFELVSMPTFILKRKGMLQRNKAVARYSYDNSAKVWSDTFDKLPNGKWNETPRIAEPNLNVPPNLDNESFINWCIANVLCEPERINSFEAMKWLKDLNYGEAVKGTSEIIFNEASFVTSNQRHMKFGLKEFVENLVRMAEKRNYYEGLRAGLVKEATPYYIVRKKVSQ